MKNKPTNPAKIAKPEELIWYDEFSQSRRKGTALPSTQSRPLDLQNDVAFLAHVFPAAEENQRYVKEWIQSLAPSSPIFL